MAVISQYQTVIPGQTITAGLWNGMELNLINNGLVCDGIEDWSNNDSQMQTKSDPYPASSLSKATDLSEEIEQIRNQISLLTGNTYWYEDTPLSISNAVERISTINDNYENFDSGTVTIFYQASAPTGWTKQTSINDSALRVVSSSGGGTGGSGSVSSGFSLAHTHTLTHTHSLVGSHTHTPETGTDILAQGDPRSGGINAVFFSFSSVSSGNTVSDSTLLTSSSPTLVLKYIDVISCSKD